MNPDVKTKWLAALRSGEYEQTDGMLLKVTGERKQHCCLGVLCELAVAEGVIPPARLVENWDGTQKIGQFGDRLEEGTLPAEVSEWSGVDDYGHYAAVVDEDGIEYTPFLTEINDEGASFAEIADIIEANF